MYSLKVCECQFGSNAQPRVWDKQVGKSIAKATLKKTTHQQYLDIYPEREATKVTNRQIASNLHKVFLIIPYKFIYVNIMLFKLKVYSLAVEKRGYIANNKRVLLANLDNGDPNPNTHAYGHYSLANDVYIQDAKEQHEAGNDLQIESRAKIEEARLPRKRACYKKGKAHPTWGHLRGRRRGWSPWQWFDSRPESRSCAPGPLSSHQHCDWKKICARDHLERPTSPCLRMPPPLSPQQAFKLLLLYTIIKWLKYLRLTCVV